MRRALWLGGCGLSSLLVFGLTLVLGWPLAGWLARIELPEELQLQGAHGSVLAGRIDSLSGPGWRVDALRWRVKPGWPLRLHSELNFSGQHWQLEASGWPWQWQASLKPTTEALPLRFANGLVLFDWQGQWQGELQLQGRFTRCLGTGGRLSSDDLALTAPVAAEFGQVELQLQCSSPRLQLDSRGPGHQLSFTADLQTQRSRLQGRIASDSALAPPAVELGLLKAGQQQVKRGWRW